MRSILRFTMWTFLGLLAAVTAVAGLWVAMGMPHDPVVLTIDDAGISMSDGGFGDWVMAVLAILVALLVVMIVLPLSLLVGIGVPALLVVLALLVTAVALGTAMLAVAAPLVLPVLAVVWLLRRDRKIAASTTIAG